MRVLFATDGSASANVARDLVARLHWPAGATIRIVGVVEPTAELAGAPFMAVVPTNIADIEAELLALTEATLGDAAATIERPDLEVERQIRRGRPASAIVDEATTFDADLVVLGSRGRGPLPAMLLGSVSAEVVDHAPCPVLVARSATPGPILFADDGSAGARTAETALAAWPILRGEAVTVLTVTESLGPLSIGILPGTTQALLDSWDEAARSAMAEAREEATTTAQRLRRAGYDATALVRLGDPAHEILVAAETAKTGLTVIGTRGRTGLARLFLGSVARNVLLHASGSVLVVRETARIRPESAGDLVTAASV